MQFIEDIKTTKIFKGINSCKYIMAHHDASGSTRLDINAVKYLATSPYGVSCNYVIGRSGQIRKIADDKQVTWHAGEGVYEDIKNSMNFHAIGIEIVSDGKNFTDAQKIAFKQLAQYLMKLHNIPAKNVIRHADYSYMRGKWDIGPNFYAEYGSWSNYQLSLIEDRLSKADRDTLKLLVPEIRKYRDMLSDEEAIHEINRISLSIGSIIAKG